MPLLSDIARRAELKLSQLVGTAFNQRTEYLAQTIMADYCQEVRAVFGIEMRPVVSMNERTLSITTDAFPATDLDREMLRRLQAKESGLDKMLER